MIASLDEPYWASSLSSLPDQSWCCQCSPLKLQYHQQEPSTSLANSSPPLAAYRNSCTFLPTHVRCGTCSSFEKFRWIILTIFGTSITAKEWAWCTNQLVVFQNLLRVEDSCIINGSLSFSCFLHPTLPLMESFDVPIGEIFPASKARLRLQRRKQTVGIILVMAIELLWHTWHGKLSGNQADESVTRPPPGKIPTEVPGIPQQRHGHPWPTCSKSSIWFRCSS